MLSEYQNYAKSLTSKVSKIESVIDVNYYEWHLAMYE